MYQTDKMLADNRDKLDASAAESVDSAVADAKKVLEDDPSKAELDKATEALQQASHSLAQVLYAQASAEPQADAGGEQVTEEEGDVIEAEVVEDDSQA